MQEEEFKKEGHEYNGSYSGKYLDRIAFPVGGMSAGMFCIDGTGSISLSVVRSCQPTRIHMQSTKLSIMYFTRHFL